MQITEAIESAERVSDGNPVWFLVFVLVLILVLLGRWLFRFFERNAKANQEVNLKTLEGISEHTQSMQEVTRTIRAFGDEARQDAQAREERLKDHISHEFKQLKR